MRSVLAVLLVATATLAGCSDGAKDGDGDGLRDSTENGWPPLLVDYLDRRVRLEVTSDPTLADTDGDGLSDFDEFFLKTNPREADTDQDGLTDCQEVIHRNQTECEDPAFSGDYDGGYDTSPVRADSDPGPVRFLNQPGRFTDETGTLVNGRVDWGDGISDKEEIQGYVVDLGNGRTRFVTSDPRDPDSDDDFLEDGEERFLYNGDPTVSDTDGDGCVDGSDPWPGFEERVTMGLESFTLKRDADLAGGADLRLTLQIAGELRVVPAAGSIRVARNQETDLKQHDPGMLRPKGCHLAPDDPWASIQVLAEDRDDPTGTQFLDVFTQSGAPRSGDGTAEVFWNLRTGQFAWDPEAPSFKGPEVRFEGLDGVLVFRPGISGQSS